MKTAHMHAFIAAPIDKVWAFITDYEGYARIPGVKAAQILAPGKPERNGLGALRKVVVMGASLEEEITRFEAPHRLCYRIVRSKPLTIEHEGGDMKLSTRDGGTEIDWTTTMELRLPLVGGLMTRILVAVVQRKFDQFLLWAKKDLERQTAS
jgi:hypothetical protein